MHSSLNNQTVESLEYWYEYYGSSWWQEIASLIVLLIGIIGFAFNVLAYRVLTNKEFNLPLYSYLRVYTACSICICLLFTTQFVHNSRQIVGVSCSIWPFWYLTKFLIPTINVFYTFSGSLDVVISLDRAILFFNFLKSFKNANPIKLSMLMFIASFILQIHMWFRFEPRSIVVVNVNKTFYYSSLSQFGTTTTSNTAMFINHLIADILPVILEITLNMIAIIQLKRHLKRKNKLLNRKRSNQNEDGEDLTSFITESDQKVKIKKKKKFNKIEIKLTIMVCVLSAISTL
jgi:hypothetical protein